MTLDERGKLHLLAFSLNIKVIQHGWKNQGIDIHGRANNSSLVFSKFCLQLYDKSPFVIGECNEKKFYLVL